MVKIMSYMDNYIEISKSSGHKTIVYGAGIYGKRALPYLKNVEYICDKNANEIKEVNGIVVIKPEELERINEELLIVICIKSEKIRREVERKLSTLSLNAFVFDYFDNIAFDTYREKELENNSEKRKLQHIHLVCGNSGWILEKFAIKMKEELTNQGYQCSVDSAIDISADINHHVIYASCNPPTVYNETFMITHIDSYNKVELLKYQLKKSKMGICMSRETMERLAMYGVPREKLCYINPAQDGVIKPKKYVLGITHRVYEDHRKNEKVLIDLCRELDPDYFAFKIMGDGWEKIVDAVKSMRFQIDYYPVFEYEEYLKLMPSLDYYLYWGFDEGSMGYLDALRAGIGTIVTPQGYHLDVKDGITYACRTMLDFREVLLELQSKRKKIVESVDNWTWKNFVNKHLEVWNYLLGNEETIYRNQHMYEDGIFSVLRMNA